MRKISFWAVLAVLGVISYRSWTPGPPEPPPRLLPTPTPFPPTTTLSPAEVRRIEDQRRAFEAQQRQAEERRAVEARLRQLSRNVEPSPPPPGSAGGAGATGANPWAAPGATSLPPASAASRSDDRRAEEARWRAEALLARNRLETAQKEHDTLSRFYLVPGYEYVDSQGKTVIRDVEHLQQLVAKAKNNLAAAERAWRDLQTRARQNSVPPGWLR